MVAAVELSRSTIFLLVLAEAVTLAAAPAVPAPPYGRCTGESGLVSADSWSEIRYIQGLDVDGREIGILVDPRSDSLEAVREILTGSILSDLDGAIADCVFGVVSSILLTLHLVEATDGLTRAQELRGIADGLLLRYGDYLPESEWPMDHDKYHNQQLLLGSDDERDCAGSSLRVYVYNSTKHLAQDRLRTGFGMMAAATHVHAYFERATCRTEDPEAADLFFVPAHHGEQYSELLQNFVHGASGAAALPYLARRRGADHIFVVGANLPSWPELSPLRHAIQLTVESYQVNDEIPRWYSPWKDIMIPGYIDRFRIAAMRAVNKPTAERGFILAFHGNHPGTHELYRKFNARVRTRILDAFSGIPDCSVGGHTKEFFERMGRSHFCLVPRGSSAWTIHLYESFFFGCIPVILSDELEVPFQDVVDWPSLSLKWPEDRVGPELLEHLRAIPLERIAAMKKRLEEHACWFDFHTGRGRAPEAALQGWARRAKGAVALANDCPYLAHGDASTLATCRRSCEAAEGCNLVNFRADQGDCVLRRCADPGQPTLVQGASGYEVWIRTSLRSHRCSPYAAIMRGLEARARQRPYTHGPHWW